MNNYKSLQDAITSTSWFINDGKSIVTHIIPLSCPAIRLSPSVHLVVPLQFSTGKCISLFSYETSSVLARVGAKKVEMHIVGSVKVSALEISWTLNWQFPWFGDTCLQKCGCLHLGNAFGCMHMIFLLIWSSIWIQVTNFHAENLLRSGSLWAICKITAKRLFLVELKKLGVSALAQEALQCHLQLSELKATCRSNAQWSWSDLSNWNSNLSVQL